MKPGISVCLPVYNGSDSIRQAIESVLNQTYKQIELLVWDDGSADDTYEIAKSYPVRAFTAPNGGVARARNRMLAEAKNDLVAMIDHDDRWTPDKLEKQVPHLEDPGVVLTHANCRFVFPDGIEEIRQIASLAPDHPFSQILPDNRLITSSVIFRKQPLIEAGGFQELSRCSDWQGWFELARVGKFVYDPEVLVTYHVRENSLANAGLRFHQGQFRVLDEVVLRRTDHLFGHLPEAERKRYVAQAWQSSGIALSSMSSCEWHAGNLTEARSLGFRALKRAPGIFRVWTRALRTISGKASRPR